MAGQFAHKAVFQRPACIPRHGSHYGGRPLNPFDSSTNTIVGSYKTADDTILEVDLVDIERWDVGLSRLSFDSTIRDKLKLKIEYTKYIGPPAKPPPFSVFNTRQKWVITAAAALAGMFSPFTANIYFPAIQEVANAFHTSVELINITVTVYMIFQGISPMIWGTLSDRLGRRPLFLVCLAILTISCVGLALVPTDAYWLLVILRCCQAAGSASTVSLGSGTISDIAEPAERGGYLGIFGLGPMVGLCLGPIVGGVLSDKLGWRSIFWFLTVFSGMYFLFFLLIFPETLRVMVGNGSRRPPRWNRELIPVLSKTSLLEDDIPLPPPQKPINPFQPFTHPSVILVVLMHGILYGIFYAMNTTLPEIYSKSYPYLNESNIGLCFLAAGLGCIVGSFLSGKLLDFDYRRIQKSMVEAKLSRKPGFSVVAQPDPGYMDPAFPIEYARLRWMPVYIGMFALCISVYGWAVQNGVNLAVPLLMEFLVGVAVNSVTNTSQTILMDLYPTQCSSISGVNNLVKCTMGALLISVIDMILKALQPAWTFTLLGAVCVALLPANSAVVRFGPKWRAARQ